MDNVLERSVYLDAIVNLLNKEGEKINVNGYLVKEEDMQELNKLLSIENILYNKKLFIESTNSLRGKVLLRLGFLKDSDSVIEKEALNNILLVLNNTPKTKLEDLTVHKKILIPKVDKELYLDNINKTILGRSKPLRDASKDDLEDLTLDVTLQQNQHNRIKEYNNEIPEVDEIIESLDEGIETLEILKNDALNLVDEEKLSIDSNKLDEYRDYLTLHFNESIKNNNEVATIYYQEMIDRFEKNNRIEELGYIYMKKDTE